MTVASRGLPAVNRGEGLSHPLLSFRRPDRCLDPRSSGCTGSQQCIKPGPGSPPFVIADLHLNHKNIIRYCRRPFRSVREMNFTLIKNWNETVGLGDTIFFLGDLAMSPNPWRWLRRLNGRIALIQGSHDHMGIPFFILQHNDILFLLIHNPAHTPDNWPGWVIHGHVHNNDLERYPFINRERRTVNVSAEVVGYKPVSLGEIEREISGN